jgi:signal transduction histidine kinase
LAYVLVTGVVVLVIDVQFYQNAKKDLMLSEYPDFPPSIEAKTKSSMGRLMSDEALRTIEALPNRDETLRRSAEMEIAEWREDTGAKPPPEKIAEAVEQIVERYKEVLPSAMDEAARKKLEAEVKEGLNKVLDRYPSMLAIQLLHGKTVVLEVRPAVPRKLDTWRNSLILRDFLFRATQPISLGAIPAVERNNASVLLMYGSPVGFKPLEDLTRTYWIYVLATILAVTVAYALTLRFVLLPIKKVTEAIRSAQDRPGRFVRNPHTRLERLFNAMARDALLTGLQSTHAEESDGQSAQGDRGLRSTPRDLFRSLAPRIEEWFHFDGAWVLELGWEGRETLVPEGQTPEASPGSPSAWDMVGPVFDPPLVRNLRTSWESRTPRIYTCALPGAEGHAFVGTLSGDQSAEEILRVLVLWRRKETGREGLSWFRDSAEKIYLRVNEMFERQLLQSRELLREKSEANVSLSRNLGHDLTNIIATNKLELMTIGQILRGDNDSWLESAEKAQVVRDCMERTLDNTRSLQEIVNLYRAYEYLKSPRYEKVDLRNLIREIVEVFQLSMSGAAEISVECPEDAPPVEVEPRLLKLAIFNLLSNAQDAIRRLPPEEQARGRILVQSVPDRAKNRIVVRVSDTGCGIRTPDGQLAGRDEIRRIFELGYTTKASGSGEGLGLNWVKTILTEFHSGDLSAYNRPEGGATFEFSLHTEKAKA